MFARPPANDNLTFAQRVRAEIAEAALAVGKSYSERELLGFSAGASELVKSLQAARPEALPTV